MPTRPPTPICTLSGFLPALARARKRHPAFPRSTWQTIAGMPAAPSQRSITAADLSALAADLAAHARMA